MIPRRIFEFGGETITIEDGLIHCPAKGAYASMEMIEAFVADRLRRRCGLGVNDEVLEIWQDSTHVNIGCLKEMIVVFEQKFNQLKLATHGETAIGAR